MLDLYNTVADGRGRWRAPTPYDANVVRSYRETGDFQMTTNADLSFCQNSLPPIVNTFLHFVLSVQDGILLASDSFNLSLAKRMPFGQ